MKKKTKKKATTKKKAKKSTRKKASTSTAGRRKKAPRSRLTVAQRDFLEAIVIMGGNVQNAAEHAGVSKWAHYKKWMKQSHYAEAYDRALARGKEVRADRVLAAVREAWEQGWDDETVEEKAEIQILADGTRKLIPVELKRKRTKKRFLNALLYEANSIFGNPARLEMEVTGASAGLSGTNGQLQITLEVARQIVGQGEEAKKK